MKYPEYIYKNVRQNLGFERDDNSIDSQIDNIMSPREVLDSFWEWEGVIGYTHKIINSVLDVYGIERRD